MVYSMQHLIFSFTYTVNRRCRFLGVIPRRAKVFSLQRQHQARQLVVVEFETAQSVQLTVDAVTTALEGQGHG